MKIGEVREFKHRGNTFTAKRLVNPDKGARVRLVIRQGDVKLGYFESIPHFQMWYGSSNNKGE